MEPAHPTDGVALVGAAQRRAGIGSRQARGTHLLGHQGHGWPLLSVLS